jgi:hypothetical protein
MGGTALPASPQAGQLIIPHGCRRNSDDPRRDWAVVVSELFSQVNAFQEAAEVFFKSHEAVQVQPAEASGAEEFAATDPLTGLVRRPEPA